MANIDGRTTEPLIVFSTAAVPGSTLVTLVEAIGPNDPERDSSHRTLMAVKIAVLGWWVGPRRHRLLGWDSLG